MLAIMGVLGQDVILNNLCGSYTAADWANDLLGTSELTITNAQSTGACSSMGLVQLDDHDIADDFSTDDTVEALVLTTGSLSVSVDTSNSADDTSTNLGESGDSDLAALTSGTTYDAAIIEFDVTAASGGNVVMQYVFVSEEYTEWSTSSFNDVFAFWINGENIALLPNDDVVSINNVNPSTNSEYFINNDNDDVAAADLSMMEWDGRTVLLTTSPFTFTAGETYHVKIGVADVGDSAWDSAIYLKPATFMFEEVDSCAEIASACGFAFEWYADSVPTYDISTTWDNFGFSDVIVSRSSDIIGQINSNGASIITDDGDIVPAKTYLDAFTDNQFKIFGEWNGEQVVSKVGHETFQQDSRGAAQGQCIKISFSHWQVLNENLWVQSNEVADDPAVDCVVFRTQSQ
jgi:hypothetical protein